MTAQPVSEYFELADYLGVLRRRWLMIAAVTLAGLVLGTAYYYVAPRVYTASVLIQVNALPTNANALGGRTGGPVNMDNEGQIVQSATVAEIAQSKLHTSMTISTLLKDIHVTVPPNTTFLQVSCSASDASLAERCANAFGRAYLYNRRFSALGVITSGIKQLEAQAAALETNIEQLRTKLGKGGIKQGSVAHGIGELQLNAKLARLGTIQSKISAVGPLQASLTAKNNFVGQIVTPAVVPARPVSPKKKLLLPSGLAGGLIIGLVAAFIWDWRRPRIRTVRDVRRRINVPTVISLLDVKNGAQTAFPPPRSRTGQAYSELAQTLGTALGDGHHVLLVVGTSPGGGNSAAANLASALARTRGETMLICADPNATAVPRLLGKADGRGFAEVLAGTAAVADVTSRTADLPQLRVLTPGLDAAGAVYDIQYDKVQRLMRDLRREVRYVVIDVPPPGTDADTFSLAEFTEGAIVVVQAGVTRPDELADCAMRLQQMRTAVLAAVVLPGGSAPSGRSRTARNSSSRSGGSGATGGGVLASSPSILPGLRQEYDAQEYNREAYEPEEQPVSYEPSRPAVQAPDSDPYAPSPRSSRSSRPAQPDYLADYPPDYQPPLPAADSAAPPRSQPASSQPMLRPVASRRHAAPGRESADSSSDPAAASSLSGTWKPRTVSENWPLPRTTLTDRDSHRDSHRDEEAGGSDPLIGG
jgi:capsular polysaccharide biosynthesis protein/Mrp family chromosome partitioning ATPase